MSGPRKVNYIATCNAINPTAGHATTVCSEEGIHVHGCQLVVPWPLFGAIHGVTPPCSPGLSPFCVHSGEMVEGMGR